MPGWAASVWSGAEPVVQTAGAAGRQTAAVAVAAIAVAGKFPEMVVAGRQWTASGNLGEYNEKGNRLKIRKDLESDLPNCLWRC